MPGGGPDRRSLMKVEHDSGAYHSYTEQEIQNYSEHLNSLFDEDPELQDTNANRSIEAK